MVQKQGFAVEDTPARILKTEGLDYLDPRPAFLAESSQQELYVPDGHLSEAGNMLVVRELRKHLARQDALRADAAVQSTGGDHP